MDQIMVERSPTQDRLNDLWVFNWPIWEKEISEFPWHYDEKEICYLLEGEVTVTPDGGGSVSFGAGDLVTFPAGMTCTCKLTRAVRKHDRFI